MVQSWPKVLEFVDTRMRHWRVGSLLGLDKEAGFRGLGLRAFVAQILKELKNLIYCRGNGRQSPILILRLLYWALRVHGPKPQLFNFAAPIRRPSSDSLICSPRRSLGVFRV